MQIWQPLIVDFRRVHTFKLFNQNLNFGFTNPSHNDLFQSWPDVSNPENYMQKIQ